MMRDYLWANDEPLDWLRKRGLEDGTIDESVLGYVPTKVGGRFANSIAIPYFDAQGRCRGVRHRLLGPNREPKYVAPKGMRKHLYNVAAADSPTVVICEGEFDSLIVRQLGYASVAITGTGGWDRNWRWLFRNSDLVLVAVDRAVPEENPDAATAEDRTRNLMLGQIGQVATDVDTVDLPEGMDITDWFLADPDGLREALA